MSVKISKSYINKSNRYQVVCNTEVVVFQGSQVEAQEYLDANAGDLTTRYADATVVAPWETVTGDYVKDPQYGKDAS